ncbi:hypothetical protein HPP92_026420 [Vanilla planifolia]|uniref:Ig-like domain-containing protein n=1 Tax=Vanilla planifolia TaxID=51239 RepID=A0A835U667_VANPL|nr:hypothetical protein HPP92_026420 [Vanilla planifolia]
METEEERNVVEEPRQLVIRESYEEERQQLVRREDRRDSMQLQEPKEMGWTSVSEKGKEIVVREQGQCSVAKEKSKTVSWLDEADSEKTTEEDNGSFMKRKRGRGKRAIVSPSKYQC